MPVQSISNYVTISVALSGAGVQAAGFGVPIFVSDHVVTSNRLDGPYTSLAAMVTAGFVSTTPEYAWASAVFSQQPRVTQVYVGRRDSGDANLAASMDAILAANPGAWYLINLESRTDADIAALAAWVEAQTQRKIAICQSDSATLVDGTGAQYSAVVEGTATDGTYILTFTGFGLPSPVAVTVTRVAGSPATNSDLGAALRAALVTAEAGSLDGVLDPDSLGGATTEATFGILGGLAAAGTVVASGTAVAGAGDLTVTTTDNAIGELLFRAQYTRTTVVYHSSDSEYLDGAWSSRCLSFDLDKQKGGWSYKRLAGITGDSLTDANVAALRSINCNYFGPAAMSAGDQISAFTAPGCMPSGDAGAGRRIDVTTSLDWLHARLEEATINVNLRDPHDVPFTDAGINRYTCAWSGVLADGVKIGHLVEFTVPEGEDQEGTKTPFLDVPQLSETTTTERENRTLSASGLVYLRSSIERVALAIEARQ